MSAPSVQVDHWLSVASKVGYGGSIITILPQLNTALVTAHCLVPPHLTVADYELFAALHSKYSWEINFQLICGPLFPNYPFVSLLWSYELL